MRSPLEIQKQYFFLFSSVKDRNELNTGCVQQRFILIFFSKFQETHCQRHQKSGELLVVWTDHLSLQSLSKESRGRSFCMIIFKNSLQKTQDIEEEYEDLL